MLCNMNIVGSRTYLGLSSKVGGRRGDPGAGMGARMRLKMMGRRERFAATVNSASEIVVHVEGGKTLVHRSERG